ncbi:MAG: PKD domain-containing protein, partial [FCB group bacterium]|nr:PKD domain-containing protein [FCB group bacterium]
MFRRTQSCRSRVQRWFAAVLIALLAAPPALAAVWFTDSRVAASGDGASWTLAKKTVGEAITASAAGDEIWVATGTYVQSITLKQGVALYGGFAGTETLRDQRDPVAYPVELMATAGQLQTVYANAITGIRLEGFIVKGGTQAGLRLVDVGATAVIANCVFRGNPMEGIRCYRSHPVIEDCFIHNNGDDGIYCYYGSPHIERCGIVANAACGILSDYGSPTVVDSFLVGNAQYGLYLNGACQPALTNCLLAGNAWNALYVRGTSAATVLNCSFISNTAAGTSQGGAILTANSGRFTLRNTVFFDNTQTAVKEGSAGDNEVSNCLFRSNPDGDYFDREQYAEFTGADAINGNVVGASGNLDGDPLFSEVGSGVWTAAPAYDSTTHRTTFTDDNANYEPGALVGLLINCDTTQRRRGLITANTGTSIEAAIGDATSYVAVGDSYSVSDFRLREDSACVDTGIGTGAPSADIEGSPRPLDAPDRGVDGSGTEYDIGVYEYQPDFGPKTLAIEGIDGGGTVAPAQGGVFDFGSTVPLVATPKRGCSFDRWLARQHVDPPVTPIERSSSENPYSLSMVHDWDVWAYFTGTPLYLLSLSAQGPGTVAATPPTGPYTEGTPVGVEATPDTAARFVQWEGDATGSANPLNLTMNEDKAVTAVFVQTHSLSITIEGDGSVEPSGGAYDIGTPITLTAVPDAGWHFERWEGALTGSTNPAELVMDADKAVTAVFVNSYTLTTASVGNGTVTPASGSYPVGDPVSVTAVPAEGWVFDHWEGAATGSLNPVSVTMDGNKTVTAVFLELPTAAFTLSPALGLLPLHVQFTDASANGSAPITAWAWDFNNDGITDSTAQNPLHTYTTAGSYTVTLSVTSAIGSDTETMTDVVRVQALPTAAFSATPTTGRAPFVASFTDASSPGSEAITAWAWDFDNDGVTDSTVQNPTHEFTAPGVYAVKLTVTTAAGSDSELKVDYARAGVPFQPQPEASFGSFYDDLVPADTQITDYDPERFAVITGLVRDINDSPIPGVAVTVLHHAEFGTAYTDSAGRFSLPVEGGASLTAVFTKPGYITSHRSQVITWNDVSIVAPVTLLAEDSASTTIVPDGNAASVYAHRSTPVSDSDGARACTLVLTGDTVANEVDANGNVVKQLNSLTVRATEFRSEESMPAQLPPTSAYTYCVELSVDEAEHIQFTKPVVMWTENFLGFAVGQLVPVGYYDREEGVWKPEIDGVVVKLLDANADGIVDALDATGDNIADDLDGDSQTADEVLGLANSQLYAVGSVFWRVEVTHFSPWDCNWPYGPPGDAVPPTPSGTPGSGGDNGGAGGGNGGGANGGTGGFGTVTHKGRAFHEDVPIAGTGLTLHYASDRTEGFKTVITVPVSDDRPLPSSLKEMRAIVEVGGREFRQVFAPALNQTAEFEWDGLDWLGRSLPQARANIRVEFVYDCVLWGAGGLNPAQLQPRSFAAPGITYTMIPARMDFISTRTFAPIQVASAKRPDTFAIGWTLSNHHRLDSRGLPLLQRGDGTTVANPSSIIDTVQRENPNRIAYAVIQGVCVDAAGNLYVADMALNRVFKVNREEVGVVFAGSTSGYFGDGGEATLAKMNSPRDVAVDALGRVFIADTQNDRIRMVDLNGIITTVAGGAGNGFGGDDGPAVSAMLNRPHGVVVDPEGNIFIADTNNHRVRKVSPAGIITTYAGNGGTGNSGDGGRATLAQVKGPRDLAIDATGSLYIASISGVNRIRKVDTTGIITTFAGTGVLGSGGTGDNGLATLANLQDAFAVAVDTTGNVYLSENARIRRIDTSGIITTFAGTGEAGYSGDGDYARLACLSGTSYGLALDPLSNLYISDCNNWVVRRITSGLGVRQDLLHFDTPIESGEYTFAEASEMVYVMDAAGKHLRTVDQATGKTLLTYAYDSNGALVSITDLFGETMTIQRNQQGTPTAIVSSDGVVTQLTVDASNHLTGVSYPDNGGYSMTYAADGLMESISANGRAYENTYDSFGRVESVLDPLSHLWNFSGQAGLSGTELYSALTPEQDQVSYDNTVLPSGAVQTSITDAAGLVTTYEQTPGECGEKVTLPTGTGISASYAIDPLYQFKKLDAFSVSMPSGLKAETRWNREFKDDPNDADAVFDEIVYTRIVQPFTSAARVWTVDDDLVTGTVTSTSPLNRVGTTLYDTGTLLVTSSHVPGLYDVTYQYDTRGRLTHTAVSTREVTFAYDAAGNLESVSEPVTGMVSYCYDALGRIGEIYQAYGTPPIGFDYDLNGNLETVTLPTQAVHSFGYDNLNRGTSYTTPLNRTYAYAYDSGGRLIEVTLPSTAVLQYNYALGRLDSVVTPDGTTAIAYDTAGRLGAVSRGTESVTFAYDGDLVTSRTLSGTLGQTVSMAYNADFSVASIAYAGATQNFAYDADDLLIGAGAFTLTRDAQNGLLVSLSDGAVTVTSAINGYGEATGVSTVVNGSTVSWSTTLDNAGRITGKTEIAGGITTTYAYTYDALGHLSTVTRNGLPDEAYTVDANGRRTLETNASRGIVDRVFTYDAEDRLLSAGAAAYTYDEDGFLATKTIGQDTTTYSYTRNGALKSVTLPDATLIEYVLDPGEQRIAKKVNGVITEKYLWAGLTGLLAVYDGADALVARFEYAGGPLPVKMVQGGATYYLAYDQVGSLRAVLNANGAVVHQIAYDTFGNILSETASGLRVPFGFAGGLHDRATGLVRFGYRDYDPDTGRWTAKDPIGFAGGHTDLYGYCGNNPVSRTDPTGLLWDLPGPYGSSNPENWGHGWNNIMDGPQAGTGWGTVQKIAIGTAGGATAIASGAITTE